MKNGKKAFQRKIAVFISHIFGDYQRNVCQGVIDKATEYGYHVDIFVSNDEKVLGEFGLGEFGVLRIPHLKSYDGVIISSSTYLLPELRRKALDRLQDCPCPIIDINSPGSPFPSVFLDNNSVTGKLVEHLVQAHCLTDIRYLGNLPEQEISNARRRAFLDAICAAGLPVGAFSSTDSDYSREGIAAALDFFLCDRLPQAIVCYNDAMAYTLMTLLAERGIKVPEQIAVTGCDYLEFGQSIEPPLTTITFPAYELGEVAFEDLLSLLDRKESGKDTDSASWDPASAKIVTASPRFGGSCGCPVHRAFPSIVYSYHLREKIASLESIALSNIRMSAGLQGVTDIDAAMDRLTEFLVDIEGLRDFYLCLYSDWDQISGHERELANTLENMVFLKLALKDKKRLPECTFAKKDVLPEFLQKNSAEVHVFTPLFFGNKDYGYLCQSYENNHISYPFTFVSWLQNVNSMLKNISDNRNMQIMLNRLEDIYRKDDLTELYNRQGFRMMLPEFLENARRENSGLLTAVLDIDGLKSINDTYGHPEGNFAIQIAGQAISQACGENILACRWGGDEFYLLGSGCTEKDAQTYIRKIQNYLEHYNQLHARPYLLSISAGYAIACGYTEEDMQECFEKADARMYENKRASHENKKKQTR